jgi:hypothetical protein
VSGDAQREWAHQTRVAWARLARSLVIPRRAWIDGAAGPQERKGAVGGLCPRRLLNGGRSAASLDRLFGDWLWGTQHDVTRPLGDEPSARTLRDRTLSPGTGGLAFVLERSLSEGELGSVPLGMAAKL